MAIKERVVVGYETAGEERALYGFLPPIIDPQPTAEPKNCSPFPPIPLSVLLSVGRPIDRYGLSSFFDNRV